MPQTYSPSPRRCSFNSCATSSSPVPAVPAATSSQPPAATSSHQQPPQPPTPAAISNQQPPAAPAVSPTLKTLKPPTNPADGDSIRSRDISTASRDVRPRRLSGPAVSKVPPSISDREVQRRGQDETRTRRRRGARSRGKRPADGPARRAKQLCSAARLLHATSRAS